MADERDDGRASPAPTPEYSTAYTEIIGDNDDLISMIAYCLYKKQKREFIIKHRLAFNDPRVRRICRPFTHDVQC